MTNAPQLYGFTARQLDAIRERRLAERKPDARGDIAPALSLVYVTEADHADSWPGRLVDTESGTVRLGEKVTVKAMPHGEPLTCRYYLAAPTDEGDGDETAPTYTVVSVELVRLAKITDVWYADGGTPDLTYTPAFSWVEQRVGHAAETVYGPLTDGSNAGIVLPGASAVVVTPTAATITFRRTTNGGSFDAQAWITGGGGSPTSVVTTSFNASYSTMASALQTALNGVGGGSGYTVVGNGTARTLTITNSGGIGGLWFSARKLTPAKRNPAYNLAMIGDGVDPVLAAKVVGSTVVLWDGYGSYPDVVITQTAWGRNLDGDTSDDRSRSVSEIRIKSIVEGFVTLKLWRTGTGDSADVRLPGDPVATGSEFAAALTAAASGAGFSVTFSVTGTGGETDPYIVSVTDTYDDYGFTVSSLAEAYGDKEYLFASTVAYGPLVFFLNRDGSIPYVSSPIPYTPAVTMPGGGLVQPLLPILRADGSLQYVHTIDTDLAGVGGPTGSKVLVRRAPTGTDDSDNPRYEWLPHADGFTGTIRFLKDDYTTGYLGVANGIITDVI